MNSDQTWIAPGTETSGTETSGTWKLIPNFLYLMNDRLRLYCKRLWGTDSFVRIGLEGDELLIPEDKGISPHSSYLFYRGQQTESNYMPMFLVRSGDKCIVHELGRSRGTPHGSWMWDCDAELLQLAFHHASQQEKTSLRTFQQISNTFCFCGNFYGNTTNTIGTVLVPTSSDFDIDVERLETDSHQPFCLNFIVYETSETNRTSCVTLLKLSPDGSARCNNNALNPQFWKRVNCVLIIHFICNDQQGSGSILIFEPILGTNNFVCSHSAQTYLLFATSSSF